MPINDKQMAKLRKIVTAYESGHDVLMTIKSVQVLLNAALVDVVNRSEYGVIPAVATKKT